MKREKLIELYKKYDLTEDNVFKHRHYLIITRAGIEKIQAFEKIKIHYDVVRCEPTFCVVKATANVSETEIQTFGSAKKGDTHQDGSTGSWYVMEMAEKRAMARVVLKVTGFYELDVKGEDESEDFKRRK